MEYKRASLKRSTQVNLRKSCIGCLNIEGEYKKVTEMMDISAWLNDFLHTLTLNFGDRID